VSDEPELSPELSVVVGLISGRREDLARCLAALANQEDPPTLEVIVPWDPPCADVATLAEDHPDVRFIEAAELDTAAARAGGSREHHDTLRTIGLAAARGRVVALTEDHAVASPTWCRDMLALVDEKPELAAIGGAVECKSDRLLNWAVYWCDFGRYQNPLPEGPARYVSDSNVAYRREALEAIRDVWAGDYHETLVHDALVARGHEIWLTPRSQVWQQRSGLTLRVALQERFVWARSYAGTRVRAVSFPKRAVFGALAFALPLLLTWRLVSGVRSRALDGATKRCFAAALPWILLLNSFWALGEFVGYLTGDPGRV
jgi:hypothetical protein